MSKHIKPIASWELRGLTFGEMLVVLAVFLTLASMFLFSSQVAITKSKVSRVMQDQREIVRAIDQYLSDNLETPTETKGLSVLTDVSNGSKYLSTLPLDIFAKSGDGSHPSFQYYRNIADRCQILVISCGPDGDADIGPAIDHLRTQSVGLSGTSRRMLFVSPEAAREFIESHSYDPTNGAISNGDIIRTYAISGM